MKWKISQSQRTGSKCALTAETHRPILGSGRNFSLRNHDGESHQPTIRQPWMTEQR